MIVIKVAQEFSRTPGPRHISEGDFSGELFRKKYLFPIISKSLTDKSSLTVDLDGTSGYGVGFLEEAFGGLIRVEGLSVEEVLNTLFIKSDEEDYLISDIIQYIQNAGIYQITRNNSNISVFDVAAYIIKKIGFTTTTKLQKLVYYCQAWSLVWDEEPLFCEDIEAWVGGPVVAELFYLYEGKHTIESVIFGEVNKLNQKQKETIDSVFDYYGNKPSQWLTDLTRMEDPWRLARKCLPSNERGDKNISLASMLEYYSSLPMDNE